MMGFCGVSMRQKLLGYLSAWSYANNEIGSESCQCINLAARGARSVNEGGRKMLARGEENSISNEHGFKRLEAFIDP